MHEYNGYQLLPTHNTYIGNEGFDDPINYIMDGAQTAMEEGLDITDQTLVKLIDAGFNTTAFIYYLFRTPPADKKQLGAIASYFLAAISVNPDLGLASIKAVSEFFSTWVSNVNRNFGDD